MPTTAPPPPPRELPTASAPTAKTPYTVMKVFFGTDREAAGAKSFGGGRGSKVSYGSCSVSIPNDHRMGQIESPSVLRLEFREDPKRHVVLLKMQLAKSKEDFFGNLAQEVRKSPKRNAFVFVHGYNVSFDDAAKRTAQLAYDLKFDGAPTFFSWPSRAKTNKYPTDEANIEWAQTHMKNFLGDFATSSSADNIYVIAHSMGNRGLTRALKDLLAERPELGKKFKAVILAAPDIDSDVFRNDIAPALLAAGQRVTLYASAGDKALLASKKIHSYPRAGDAGAGLVLLKGLDTIDASGVETDFLGHSYYGSSNTLISDMYWLIKEGSAPAARRNLRAKSTADGDYWEFAK